MKTYYVPMLLVFVGLFVAVHAWGQDSAASSIEKRVVNALRTEGKILVDGDLAEKDWERAEKAAEFFRAQPVRGVRAQLKTEAMVLFDDTALYIGFRCFEPDMTRLRETLTRRDSRIWEDDAVEVVLDTYDDDRNGYIFGVNTLGTQMDQHVSNESVFTLTWDARWEAQVVKGKNFWTAEFAIPFSELRFSTDDLKWGINFWRAHPIDGEAYSWSDTGGDFGRISEFGELRGLFLGAESKQRKLGILPYATYRTLENLPDDRGYGVDFLIQPSTNLTSNITINPDFSQLESDPTKINVSDDRELSLPERRPFFREGADLFQLPLNLFYSRRVQEIDFGLKTTGKVGTYNLVLLNTYGRVVDRYEDDRKRRANLFNLRLNRDIGDRAVVGVMGIQKHQADRDFSLLSLNSRVALQRDWSAQLQSVVNHVEGRANWAYHASTRWTNERGWFGNLAVEEIENGFRPNETGLTDEAYRKLNGQIGYRHKYPEGSRLRWYQLRYGIFYQTDEERKLRERFSSFWGGFDVGRFDFIASSYLGKQREDGIQYDYMVLNLQAGFNSTWNRLVLFSRFAKRLNRGIRQVLVFGDANLLERVTIDFFGDWTHWHGHRKTWLVRLKANYQFHKKMGSRLYVERVDEQLLKEVSYNFNWVLDYEFTPESHFYLVFVHDQQSRRGMFAKLAYLFDSNVLARR